MLIEIQTFSFTKVHLKMLSGKWQPSCLSINALIRRSDESWSLPELLGQLTVSVLWPRSQQGLLHREELATLVAVHKII